MPLSPLFSGNSQENCWTPSCTTGGRDLTLSGDRRTHREGDWLCDRSASHARTGIAGVRLPGMHDPRTAKAEPSRRERAADSVRLQRTTDQSRLRLDLVVEDCIIVELKAVERLDPIHQAQVITYLKLAGLPVGLLMNFNAPTLKAGLKRLDHPDRYMKRA